jgi:hypothetical protein
MEAKKDNDSLSYVKENLIINKECRHKFKKLYGKKRICVKCGFEKWW